MGTTHEQLTAENNGWQLLVPLLSRPPRHARSSSSNCVLTPAGDASPSTRIEDYLTGRRAPGEVAEWALGVVCSKEWERLPHSVRHAIHLLFDLHDGEHTAWAPTREELPTSQLALKEDLKGLGGPPDQFRGDHI